MIRAFSLSAVIAAAVACAPLDSRALDLNPLSAIKGAVETVVEDRSAEDIATDTRIKAELTAEVIDKLGKEVISINTDVYEQDVMITGAVENTAIKAKVTELARSVGGIKKLYNDMIVRSVVDKDKGAVEGFVDDSVIEGKINVLLVDAEGVNATNFRWRSIEGHVFLFGRALSDGELRRAVGIVKTVKNVRSLTNRAKVRAKAE